MAPPIAPLSAVGIIKRHIKTPGEVFGFQVKHKVYLGTVTKRDKPRGTIEGTPAESEDLSDDSDPDDCEDSDTDADAGAAEKVVPVRRKRNAVETAEQKQARLDSEERKKTVTEAIYSSFVENKRAPSPTREFKHAKPSDLFHDPPDDIRPGLLKTLLSERPRNIEDCMLYVFDKLLPKSFWLKLSKNSLKYAAAKKAGEDVNAEKEPADRHPLYQGKGKQRPWDPKWVNPNGLLLFHQSLLVMVMNKRGAAMDHFSHDTLLRYSVWTSVVFS
ncbi:hypothetical protein CYMTET_14737 [Cymbomonas tetramitiformis]|uniref:Uncharacterized protein n=1 Tax=Cymbomonas tetramitiformis TaxID=36881 RepID=A0AAE0GG11_9CHLO|nr:hypothetical protein CYMTET_14737 [Cymbomonas tetramitiformis]